MARRKTFRIAVAGVAALLLSSAAVAGSDAMLGSVAGASVVTAVTATPNPLTAGDPATYTVAFTPTTSLVIGDTITMSAPTTTVFSTALGDYTVGTDPISDASTATGNDVTITVTQPVPAGSSVTVIATGATNSIHAGPGQVTVETSKDSTTPIGVSPNFTLVAGPATQIVPSAGTPQSAGVTAAFSTALTATVEDVHGNPVLTPSGTVTFTAPSSGASGTFAGGTNTITIATIDGTGVATATAYTANTTSGTYAVTASQGILTSATYALTNNPDVPAQVTVTAGGAQSANPGSTFATPLSATIEDRYGNPAPTTPGSVVTFTAPSGGASGTFSDTGTNVTTATTDTTTGVATAAQFTANTNTGSYRISAAAATTPVLPTVSVSATNISGPTPPSAPTVGSASAGDGNATITWAAPTNNNGAPVLAYLITPSSGSPTIVGNVTNATVTGLTNATGYTFTVAAYNAAGLGASSHATNSVTPQLSGYRLVASDGGIFSFGKAGFLGSTGSTTLNKPIVGMATTPGGAGYWLVASDGGIFAYGDAGFYGSTGAKHLNSPIVGMATTPDGMGYWLVASDGGIFSFGTAAFHGSTGATTLNKPIVGMAGAPDGRGYWLVASDGGIFSFGTAAFHGSTGATTLNKPIVGMAGAPDGKGYWLVASDGGIFSFGTATFLGSTGNKSLNKPIVGMATTANGDGYSMVASDGGLFTFGNATFHGSTGSENLNQPIVGMSVS